MNFSWASILYCDECNQAKDFNHKQSEFFILNHPTPLLDQEGWSATADRGGRKMQSQKSEEKMQKFYFQCFNNLSSLPSGDLSRIYFGEGWGGAKYKVKSQKLSEAKQNEVAPTAPYEGKGFILLIPYPSQLLPSSFLLHTLNERALKTKNPIIGDGVSV